MIAVLMHELKDIVKSKRAIFALLVLVFAFLTVYVSGLIPDVGLISDGFSLQFTISYYLVFVFIVPICLILAFNTISGEVETKTIRMILTKSSRIRIYLGKFLALSIVMVLIILSIILYSAYNSFNAVGSIDTGHVATIILLLSCYAICVLSLVIFSSSITKGQLQSFGVALVIMFFFLFLAFTRNCHLSPFCYIWSGMNLNDVGSAISLFIGYGFMAISFGFLAFWRRDL